MSKPLNIPHIGALVRSVAQNHNAIGQAYRAIEQADSFRSLICSYHNPLINAQQGLGDISVLRQEPNLSNLVQQFESYRDRFQLPEKNQIISLSQAIQASLSAQTLGLNRPYLPEIQDAIHNLRQPWLDSKNMLGSLAAVTELHTVATGLLELPPFGKALTTVLRQDFGDWRTISPLPKPIFTDPVARFDFYRDRGFNDALTDFPEPGFTEILDNTGLRPSSWPEPEQIYGRGLDFALDEESEDEVPKLNLEAYGIVYRLETHMRRFIDEQMTNRYGRKWTKDRTPDSMYRTWQCKQKKESDAGKQPSPLIAYADFTDYNKIICRKDNWNEVFKSFFKRKEDIQESLIRLGPVRVCTMHARIITADDHLILLAESKRILRTIGVKI